MKLLKNMHKLILERHLSETGNERFSNSWRNFAVMRCRRGDSRNAFKICLSMRPNNSGDPS